MPRINLFLVSCPRGGSTQLATWLASHPTVGMSAIKEPNFFAAGDFPEDLVAAQHLDDIDPADYFNRANLRRIQFAVLRKAEQYQRLADELTTFWRMEASTSYLASNGAAERIWEYNPDARIILLTRDPLARALSHYHLALRTGRTIAPLGTELEIERTSEYDDARHYLLRPSRYRAGLADFARVFPADQRFHLTLEEMAADPMGRLSALCGFLDLDPAELDLCKSARNAQALPRLPGLNHWLLKNGMKTRIRALLPTALKPTLRRFWFDDRQPSPVSAKDRGRLAELLAENR